MKIKAMAKSRTAQYYAENPEARKKKAAYDKALNRRPKQIKKRSEANQKRAEAKKKGMNIKGKDYDHAVNKFVSVKTNRGRLGEGGR